MPLDILSLYLVSWPTSGNAVVLLYWYMAKAGIWHMAYGVVYWISGMEHAWDLAVLGHRVLYILRGHIIC